MDTHKQKNSNNINKKAVEEIVIFTSYIIDDDGKVNYDLEIMREDFENELLKLNTLKNG